MTDKHNGIDRRRVVQGMAWTAPAILIATAAPAAATSPGNGTVALCDSSQNGLPVTVTSLGFGELPASLDQQYHTTGWTPLQNDWLNVGSRQGFMSMDDTTLRDGPVTIVLRYAFTATTATRYEIAFSSKTGFGGGGADNASSRQSVHGVITSTAGQKDLLKLSLKHVGGTALPAGNTSDAAMISAGYTLTGRSEEKAWKVGFDAEGGNVVLTFTFTIEPVAAGTGKRVSDDIWISTPVVTQVSCLS